jgi:hypothetical protein
MLTSLFVTGMRRPADTPLHGGRKGFLTGYSRRGYHGECFCLLILTIIRTRQTPSLSRVDFGENSVFFVRNRGSAAYRGLEGGPVVSPIDNRTLDVMP